jgi:tRNA nucleotidyltransferase (CCA-adding enzyme)
MQSGRFRQWLAEQGCGFRELGPSGQSASVEVRHGDRRAVLAPQDAGEPVEESVVLQTVKALGLRCSDLPGRWEHFPHGADIGVRGIGYTLARAFAEAARAMTAAAVDPDEIRPASAVDVSCEGRNPEDLLYAWLNAVVYEMAVRRMLFGKFEVEIEGGTLRAVARGEPVSQSRHEPAVEIKGATMTALSVRRENDEWIAQCVVDV